MMGFVMQVWFLSEYLVDASASTLT